MATSTLLVLICVFSCGILIVRCDKILECTEAVQGDVLLNHYQKTSLGRRRLRRAAASDPTVLWVNNTIPYDFGKTLSESQKRKIRKAIADWENKTCIRFKPHDNDTDYVTFTIGRGCCSNIGRQGGHQTVVLGYGCYSHRIILHEIGHLVGFWHEQGRPDRDDYVNILYKNIRPGEIQQFFKKSPSSVTSLGQPFDYRSIMLYGKNTFSRNNRRTIVAKLTSFNIKEQGENYYKQHTTFGTSELSQLDILQANLLYKCPHEYENGQVLVGRQGNFTSPNFPKPYNKSLEKTWTIIAADFNDSQMLVLLINEFNVGVKDPVGECHDDWLEIREGKGPKSPYLTRLCGKRKSTVITVFGDSLFIRLRSTNSTKRKPRPTLAAHQPLQHWWLRIRVKRPVDPPIGFSLRYKKSDCKYIITNSNGTIQSPEYPNIYQENMDCVWQISAPKGFRIHIEFEDFDFRAIDEENGCVDYLEMREGTKISSKFLNLHCGRDFPRKFATSSNNLRLFMHTTLSGNIRRGRGFKAHYRIEDIDECEGREDLCEQGCVNYPGGYTCGCLSAYHIVGTGPDVRCLDVDECQANNGGCSHYCTNTKGGHFCTCPSGYYLEDDQKTCKDSDECMLSICSQKCVNTPGSFKCSCKYGYALDNDGKTCKLAIPMCTGVLSSSVGKFTSPAIPSWYRGYVDCEWTIRVRQRYTIGMYLKLSWSRNQKCSNYIKISMNEGSGVQTMKLCGHQDVEGMLNFKAHELRVHYHTEAPYTKGFSLKYHMRPKKENLCGGDLYRHQGTVMSPNYPSFYPGRCECLWKIKSPRGRGALLSFEFFDLENQTHCIYDFLDIKTNVAGKIRPVGRFCGTKKPPLITVDDGEIWIKFHSDGTVQKSGFRATYRFR